MLSCLSYAESPISSHGARFWVNGITTEKIELDLADYRALSRLMQYLGTAVVTY